MANFNLGHVLTKATLERLFAIGVAAIGAIGEAIILFHWLVDCYPFKMMTYPSDEFYAGIAYAGFVLGPILAIAAAYFLSRRGVSFVPAVAVIICPTVFWMIFAISSFVYGIDNVLAASTNYDHTTHAQVQAEFLRGVYQLILVGVVVGAISGILAKVVARGIGIPDHIHTKSGY